MEREIRYCTTEDGVRIAYSLTGKGPPLLVSPLFVESFSLEHLFPVYESFMRRLGLGRTVIRYDVRGSGLSQRDVTDTSLDAFVADIGAVAEASAAAANLGRVSVWAPTSGGAPAIQYAAKNSTRVAALILYGTWARITDIFSPQALQGLAALASANWPMAARAMADVGSARAEAGDAIVPLADMFVQSASGETVARSIMASAEVDVTPFLSKVRARTLIIHRRTDTFVPLALGQALAAAIPNARLVTPPGTMHGFFLGDCDSIVNAVNTFLDEDAETRRDASGDWHDEAGAPPETQSPSGMTAILFADIVDSTALTERFGDAAFRERARDLDGALRATIREHAGTPIEGKLLGDGVLAVFTSARQAIEAALACGHAGNEGGLPLHLGLHAGDVIREENNVYGGAVNIASRISGLSAPGEVLVSETVRSLARTSAGVRFEDQGEQALKGVEEPVRVWAVRPFDTPAGAGYSGRTDE